MLLDEFDELVLDRSEPMVDTSSRFLTTAMLPKIAALASRRRIVYLLATNHIERFDDAISRQGRFDLVVPVMPPSLYAKLAHWPMVAQKLTSLKLIGDEMPQRIREGSADLTYFEFVVAVPSIKAARSQTGIEKAVDMGRLVNDESKVR